MAELSENDIARIARVVHRVEHQPYNAPSDRPAPGGREAQVSLVRVTDIAQTSGYHPGKVLLNGMSDVDGADVWILPAVGAVEAQKYNAVRVGYANGRPVFRIGASPQRWLRVVNNSISDVPAYGVVASAGPTGAALDATTGQFAIAPLAAGTTNSLIFFAGQSVIAQSGGTGYVTQDWPAWALYDTADGDPAPGEVWGPQIGTFKLRKGVKGFIAIDNGVSGLGLFEPANQGLQDPVTTKGDLWTFSTVDAALAVGTNQQVLTSDSTTSVGLKWATMGAGNGLQLGASSGALTYSALTQMSITTDGSGLKLVSDSATPGNSKYYGTNASGSKGFFDLAGAGGGPGVTVYTINFNDAGLNVASTTATLTIATLAQNTVIESVEMDHTTQFTSSGALATLTAKVQDQSTPVDLTTARVLNIAPNDPPTFATTQVPAGNFQATNPLKVLFTATGANLNTLTAGVLKVRTLTWVG